MTYFDFSNYFFNSKVQAYGGKASSPKVASLKYKINTRIFKCPK